MSRLPHPCDLLQRVGLPPAVRLTGKFRMKKATKVVASHYQTKRILTSVCAATGVST
jgi:hypothetical protein